MYKQLRNFCGGHTNIKWIRGLKQKQFRVLCVLFTEAVLLQIGAFNARESKT